MNYLLGIDLGTSGTKTVLFNCEGKAIAQSTIEYPMYQPKNGWAEQDPNDWWNAAKNTSKAVIEESQIDPNLIKGVGISGQMHGLVLLDENNNVLYNSIIWCDGRTQAECDEITAVIGKERLIEISANAALTSFTAGKILWIQKNEPAVWAKTRHIMLPKDYVAFKLTGKYSSEMSDASGTNLLDVKNRAWSKEICDKLNIPLEYLNPLFESSDCVGNVCEEASKETLIPQTAKVAAGAGDNAAAAVGTGVVKKGTAFTTIGTSGVIFAHSDEPQIDPKGRVNTFCAAVPGSYTIMPCILSAGFSLKWFRDTLCHKEMSEAEIKGIDPYIIMNELADASPIGANGLIFTPYLMGERSPLLDPDARGSFVGISGIHQKGDLIRALMEGVIYALRQNLDIMRSMNVAPQTMMACGGGAKSPFWRQMMADIFNMPVVTVKNTEGPALGAAILGGVAAGVYKDIPSACESVIALNTPLTPNDNNAKEYDSVYDIFLTVYPALKDTFKKLSGIRK